MSSVDPDTLVSVKAMKSVLFKIDFKVVYFTSRENVAKGDFFVSESPHMLWVEKVMF